MKKIELEQWEPFPGDPQRMQYAGQRVAQEVFEELKHRLEGMGYLPDEYFLMDREWENGREIPKDADIFCTTDYGGNEGVYLDVYLKWYEDSRPVTKSFITGKTLGETGADLDRMFLISSAITKAFHGDGETYARHLRQGERAEPEGMIVHLNPTEQRTIIEALVEQQERQEQAMSQTEQLLRRMTGSITAYMDEVGRYPLHISDYDKTVLAIRDGEFDAFKNLYPRVSDQTDDLLIEVAGRPGVVGGNMTLILLAAVERFSPEAYLTACKRAVETGDSWRVQTLVKESEGRLSEPLPSLHGEVILYAYTNNCRNIAKDLIAQCTPEQIASVPPKLLRWVAEKLDFQTAVDLVDKGVRPGDEVAGILRTLTGQHQEWMAERLLEHGMPVEPDNYDALYACVSNQAVGAAKLMLYGTAVDVTPYRKAVTQVGTAWGLPIPDTQRWLDLIRQEEIAVTQAAEPEKVNHVMEEKDLPINASGLQTLDNIWGLFETAVKLNSADGRREMYALARELSECQNLTDWIIKSQTENEGAQVSMACTQN